VKERAAPHVTVRDTGVAAFPAASVTFHVRVCEVEQLFAVTLPSTAVGVSTVPTGPQGSVAVAVPRAASICAAVGLSPNTPFSGLPVATITGGVVSLTITLNVQLAVLVFMSVAVTVTRLVPTTKGELVDPAGALVGAG